MHHREQRIIEQSVSSGQTLADTLALHKIWIESNGQQGSRADLSDEKFVGAVLRGMNFERAVLRKADFSNADLRNADLSEAVFVRADLRGTDFSGADLTDISMRNCNAGPAAKGFAEAYMKAEEAMKAANPDRSHRVRYDPVPLRAEPEREFGPSR